MLLPPDGGTTTVPVFVLSQANRRHNLVFYFALEAAISSPSHTIKKKESKFEKICNFLCKIDDQ